MKGGPDLSGKTAIITGATGTLGKAIAHEICAAGGNTLLVDRGGPALEQIAAEVGPKEQLCTVSVDMAAPDYAQSIVEVAQEAFGSLDILITAAGLLKRSTFAEAKTEDIALMAQVNFDYAVELTKAAIPAMTTGGAIVHLASLSAHTGRSGSAHYAAQKGALVALTKSIAAEFAPKIRANCVSPGFVRSPLANQVISADEQALLKTIPLQRFGLPAEVAKAVVFLCSDWASYITGQVLHVNGGQFAPG